MADVDLRALERRWREERSIGAARDYIAARLRLGALRDRAQPGGAGAAPEAFLEGLAGGDPAQIRAALSALDAGGPAGGDRAVPEPFLGAIPSQRSAPFALQWSAATSTPAERFVAGWLETLGPDELRGLWAVDVLSEPAVTAADRAALRAALQLPPLVHPVVETARWTLRYSGNRVYMEGMPAAADLVFERLVHGLLRRGLVCQLREGSGGAAAIDVVCAVLDCPALLEPSVPELLPVLRTLPRPQPPGEHLRVGGEVRDAYGLRGALAVIAALPELARDERVAASLARLIPGQLGRATVSAAVVLHLAPALGALPEPLGLAFLEAVAEGRWGGDYVVRTALVDTITERGEGWTVSLRWAAEEVLRSFASHGALARPLRFLAERQLSPGKHERTSPWLRELAADLIRALAASTDARARREVALLWDGKGRGAVPGFGDVWGRLSEDPDEGVRRALSSGPDPYEYDS